MRGGHARPDAWTLLTAVVAAATVGLVVFNVAHIFSRPSRQGAQARSTEAVALQILLETRSCPSPALDAYAHVNVTCIKNSPTARWWREFAASGGRASELVVHIEQGADYDGLAVRWGAGHKVKGPLECAQACWRHVPGGAAADGPFGELPCNAFTYCNADVCFEPDAHNHTRGDCWLKFTEAPAAPEVNMRGRRPEHFRQRHPDAPLRCPWIAGVLLPPGVAPTNGSWSPRYWW